MFAETLKEGVGSGSREGESAQREWRSQTSPTESEWSSVCRR